ncbi:hypothetical protein LZ575_03675 [Antarcticibacterium sp. 1MA-6-2]|uniref:hypothetical protein n=1 Tax=Antarcticibacterium sp. 1MA-6-2 TaxID=2908210 RepID=UPI001F486927|nr:hypothetical protein [Antarcticibacterium sp. 1MA-6-2]UJH91784.1 hypothetical protein LZ575_03675 [Antarcticibacterium sp. 1MA-6-2]
MEAFFYYLTHKNFYSSNFSRTLITTFVAHDFPYNLMTKSIIHLDFGKVWFRENILIAELNEGILFDVDNNRQLLEIGKNFYVNKPYGYISHRIHSYAVNPMVYLESANVENLKAIAVVTTNDTCKKNTLLERQFYKDANSFEVFDTLDNAFNWIQHKI